VGTPARVCVVACGDPARGRRTRGTATAEESKAKFYLGGV
jgi:hypothetical protein